MVEDNVDMMNSQQYIEFRDKIGSPVSDEVRQIVDKYGISTNWRDQVFNNSAPTYSVDASLSGGGENINYYISLNHYDAEGIITESDMRRETLRANINSKVNDWLRIGLQTNLGYTKYSQNANVTSEGVYLANPMVFARMAFPYDSPIIIPLMTMATFNGAIRQNIFITAVSTLPISTPATNRHIALRSLPTSTSTNR